MTLNKQRREIKRSRRFNYILSFVCLILIGTFNLTGYLDKENKSGEEQKDHFISFLDPKSKVEQLHFSGWKLEKNNQEWKAISSTDNKAISFNETPEELVERWLSLVGTEIDSDTYTTISSQLSEPGSIDVWLEGEHALITLLYYQTPNYWLFQNVEDKWLAVSVEEAFLFPSAIETQE